MLQEDEGTAYRVTIPLRITRREKTEDTTAKNITIKFLKYLFLYVKSGRTTFNNHDLTSLVVRELHHNDSHTLTPTSKRANHEKDKSSRNPITPS